VSVCDELDQAAFTQNIRHFLQIFDVR